MKKDLPDGWKYVSLLDYMDLVKPGAKRFDGTKKYVATGSLETGLIKAFIEVDDANKPSRANVEVQKGDVLFAKMKDTEKVFLIETEHTDYLFSTGFSVLRIKDKQKFIPKYIYYWLRSNYFQNKKNKECSGATQKAIGNNKLKEFKIIAPPLETQYKIVEILEKTEEAKKLRAQADELTQQLLQSVFFEMFGDPISNPKGWKTKKLKNIAEIVSGVTKGRKISGKTTVYVPYLRVANAQDGYLDLSEIKTIEVLPSDVEKYRLIDGDVLLTEGGDPDKLGRGAVWHGEIENCIHQNHIFRVRINQEYLVPEYFSMLAGSSYGKRYFLKSAKQTTGIASINSTQLKNFPTLLPPLELQHKFTEIIIQLNQTKQLQYSSFQELDNLFNTLMQKAFKGELVS